MFRPQEEASLARLGDDELIAYVHAARAAAHPSARVALAVLVYGHWHNVARRVALKVPFMHLESDPNFYSRFKREEEIGK